MFAKQPNSPDGFTVVYRTHSGMDGDSWQLVIIGITGVSDVQEAADNVGLFLIRNQGGQAEACLVMEGISHVFNVHGGIFDAEEYDETITYAGKIVSIENLKAPLQIPK